MVPARARPYPPRPAGTRKCAGPVVAAGDVGGRRVRLNVLAGEVGVGVVGDRRTGGRGESRAGPLRRGGGRVAVRGGSRVVLPGGYGRGTSGKRHRVGRL